MPINSSRQGLPTFPLDSCQEFHGLQNGMRQVLAADQLKTFGARTNGKIPLPGYNCRQPAMRSSIYLLTSSFRPRNARNRLWSRKALRPSATSLNSTGT